MKTTSFFSMMIVFTIMFLGMMSVNAQNPQTAVVRPTYNINTPANVELGGIDTAVTDAHMPYGIAADVFFVTQSALFNASGFQWSLSGAGTLMNPANGALTDSPDPDAGFYLDTVVRAYMPAAVGQRTLSVAEKSYPKFGATACVGATQNLTIDVIAKPTMGLNAAETASKGACTAADYVINYDFTGYGPWYVNYTITATTFAGAALGSQTYQAVVAIGADLMIDDTQLTAISGAAGKYQVSITAVWDRISWRALNQATVATVPGVATYDVYIFPTPVTNQIKQLKNN